MPPSAAIAVIGNEILSGKFADANSPFLIGALRELGVDIGRVVMIPDEVPDIAATVRGLSERFDFVFTSGGVGPTHDDVTMEGIALGWGVEVAPLPGLVELLKKFYGAEPTSAQLRLAEAPVGAELIYGTDPIWPVTLFRNVYIFPGVPALLRRKFNSVKERFRAAEIFADRVYLAADESDFADALISVVAAHPDVEIGSYPRFEEKRYRVVLIVESRSRESLAAAVKALETALAEWTIEPETAEADEPS